MNELARIRILVADDYLVVRKGLVTVINSQPDMVVVAEAMNGRQAVEMFQQHEPDILLIDLRMPLMSGLEAVKAIRQQWADARIIVLTMYDGDEDIYRAFQAGARAYLLKDMVGEQMLTAIREVYAGRRHIPPEIGARLAERMPLSELTAREVEVLSLIVKGLTNSEIAGVLKISKGTVKIHVNNIYGKLGVNDRTQATTTALQRGIVHLD
ncbi:MAG TPA: response regulator transcription factor [Blastocatellia bacterium]|nr:response regulator transcription factor [Blastocatellia bacterium]